MLKLIFMIMFFFLGYFFADTKLIEIPFEKIPKKKKYYHENQFKHERQRYYIIKKRVRTNCPNPLKKEVAH